MTSVMRRARDTIFSRVVLLSIRYTMFSTSLSGQVYVGFTKAVSSRYFCALFSPSRITGQRSMEYSTV